MSKSIYSKIDRKEKSAYRKMYKKHRKEMIRLAKEDKDFDWSYLHDLVIAKVKHMYEYYKEGNNVWQTDETRIPIINQLKYILDTQYELDHLYDELEKDIIIENTDNSFIFNDSSEYAQTATDLYNKEVELYKKLYAFIGEHLQEWWD